MWHLSRITFINVKKFCHVEGCGLCNSIWPKTQEGSSKTGGASFGASGVSPNSLRQSLQISSVTISLNTLISLTRFNTSSGKISLYSLFKHIYRLLDRINDILSVMWKWKTWLCPKLKQNVKQKLLIRTIKCQNQKKFKRSFQNWDWIIKECHFYVTLTSFVNFFKLESSQVSFLVCLVPVIQGNISYCQFS